MVNEGEIRKDMRVVGADGIDVGTVDHIDNGRVKLSRRDSTDGQHHYVPLSRVARVDEHVHLTVSGTAAFDDNAAGTTSSMTPNTTPGMGAGAAAATGAAALGASTIGSQARADAGRPQTTTTTTDHGPREVHVEHDEERKSILPWILLGLGLLALLAWLFNRPKPVENPNPTPVVAERTVPTTETVTLPGGRTVAVAPNTLNYDLNRFLASNDPAPKTFGFDKLNFDTGSAAIRAEDRPTLDALGDILAAYPKAKAVIVGYTDSTGTNAVNAELSAKRSLSVMEALVAKGVEKSRLTTKAGGVAATAGGSDQNARRTELMITAK